ncbi:MAG: DUF3795 domain-containing protein [Candidatus Omnitrophota bacterium]
MAGIYNCRSSCEAYLATQANDDSKRAEVARKWTVQYGTDIKPEHINCDGCRAGGRKFFYCSSMCELRKCCLERDLENCAVCEKYVCDKLAKFFEIAPEPKKALEEIRKGL